jgi:tRNA G18 (ribose-2'-O)-methylase SpoU
MPEEFVDNLDDPRLRLYRNLKDGELAREGDRFIVEGHFVVQRVLVSDFPVESVLIAQRKLEEMRSVIPEGLPVYVVPDRLVNGIVGFQFHTGVMAIARRKLAMPLDELMGRCGERATLMVLPETSSLQNMGAMIRIGAAFGVDGFLTGPESVDPFYRLPVRVSMGTCFKMPIVRSGDLAGDLRRLREQWGVELAATVLDPEAEPLDGAVRGPWLGLLLGGEAQGLGPPWLAACSRRLTIPMQWGVDSLNVAVAAGVFLYHFTRLAEQEAGPSPS